MSAPDASEFDSMFEDFESMIDKLKYYAQMAKDYGSGEESDPMESEDAEELDDGEEPADPKTSAFVMQLKRKMKE